MGRQTQRSKIHYAFVARYRVSYFLTFGIYPDGRTTDAAFKRIFEVPFLGTNMLKISELHFRNLSVSQQAQFLNECVEAAVNHDKDQAVEKGEES